MSGYEGRTKGKRFRKLQSGGSNAHARWKYMSAAASDVLEDHIPRLHNGGKKISTAPAGRHAVSTIGGMRVRTQSSGDDGTHAPAPVSQGFDIDGDGQVDVRELRMTKILDSMLEKRRKDPATANAQDQASDSQWHSMRQEAGRMLIASEFVERNAGRLWRYGSVFTGKTEAQSAEFIAAHKNFGKFMAFLENEESKRNIRTSQCMRGFIQSDLPPPEQQPQQIPYRQTWIETSRKVHEPAFSKHPLPELQPRKKELFSPHHGDDAFEEGPEVVSNSYGAIDVDGDGVIDDFEMQLNLRLQEATLGDGSSNNAMHSREFRHQQQLEGRRMMAKDFVDRNEGQLWLYDSRYRDLTADEVVQQIASKKAFSKELNKLRATERLLKLKSSVGVSGCMKQLPVAELPPDPSNTSQYRRVRDRTELMVARRELLKPQQQRKPVSTSLSSAHLLGIREDTPDLTRTMSESQVGLPRIFDTPVRIEPTGCFSVTKWKFGDR